MKNDNMCNDAQNVIGELAKCASENRLLLFLGAGFSKAVVGYDLHADNHYNGSLAKGIPSWVELLKQCRAVLGLATKEYDSKLNLDCPVEASEMVTELQGRGMDSGKAIQRLKSTICRLTDFYPNSEQVCAFQKLFEQIKPALIITTNYDEVIETVLHRGYYAYSSDEVFERLPDGMTPVYHLHGVRRKPESIVITREDYVEALRPFTYRQQKLACLLREYAVVYIGYQKNDINVLSALDCASKTFVDVGGRCHLHVQLIHSDSKDTKLSGKDGQKEITCGDTFLFLKQLAKACRLATEEEQKKRKRSEGTRDRLLELADPQMLGILHTKRTELSGLLKKMGKEISGTDLSASFNRGNYICLIQKLYATARSDSYKDGNFKAYDDCLFIIIELLKNMEEIGIDSFFFDFAVKRLDEIARYIGSGNGQSWMADRSIRVNWAKIPQSVREALRDAAQRHGRTATLSLLRRLSAMGGQVCSGT